MKANKTNNKAPVANGEDSYIRNNSYFEASVASGKDSYIRNNSYFEAPVASGKDSYIRNNSYFKAPVANGEDSYIRKNSLFAAPAFTLIELIIVIAIIAILAAAIFVAVDPARRLNESNNSRRWSDVTNIVEAIVKYQTDNSGTHYGIISGLNAGTYYVIGTDAGGSCGTTCSAKSTDNDCKDLSGLPSNYMGNVPFDPKTGSVGNTDYYISRTTTNNIIVGACDAQGTGAGGTGTAPTIELTR